MCELPQDLYDEVISYLRNDTPSLEACSLANRSMTIPCQKLLFQCIELLGGQGDKRGNTSYNFHQLLAGSPHIAGYVQSLHIRDTEFKQREPILLDPSVFTTEQNLPYEDYVLRNGDDLVLDGPVVPYEDTNKRRLWLPEDKFLPLVTPLLHNLNALAITYRERWSKLSLRVLISLLHLMQLPSLHYLRLCLRCFPSDLALGGNVKHLIVDHTGMFEDLPVRCLHPPSAPIYLDSFSIRGRANPIRWTQFPTPRIQLSRLRKLVFRGYDYNDHASFGRLLQSCSSLEDFEIFPGDGQSIGPPLNPLMPILFLLAVMETVNLPSANTGRLEGLIDLGKLVSLRRFAVSTWVSINKDGNVVTPFLWLSKILQGAYSTQTLKELSIRVEYYCSPGEVDIRIWKDVFDILLDDRFNLKTFNIAISGPYATAYEAVEELMYCDDLRELGCRLGKPLSFYIDQDGFEF